mgnify:CR=1 FL=1
MPSGAILKEEGTVPPMPLDAFVKEEVVITKEEEEADELGSASDSDDGFPEPDDRTEEEEAGNRLQQQLDEDKSVQVANDLSGSSADQQEALRVASLSNEELSFEAAQRLGGSVAEQLEILQTIQACSAEGPAHSLDAAVALRVEREGAVEAAHPRRRVILEQSRDATLKRLAAQRPASALPSRDRASLHAS